MALLPGLALADTLSPIQEQSAPSFDYNEPVLEFLDMLDSGTFEPTQKLCTCRIVGNECVLLGSGLSKDPTKPISELNKGQTCAHWCNSRAVALGCADRQTYKAIDETNVASPAPTTGSAACCRITFTAIPEYPEIVNGKPVYKSTTQTAIYWETSGSCSILNAYNHVVGYQTFHPDTILVTNAEVAPDALCGY